MSSPKNNQYENSIIKTLCYSDVFDYPLKISEINRYYIGRKCSEEKIYLSISSLISKGLIEKTGEYIYLSGRKKLSALRKKREKISGEKWKVAVSAINLLSHIPTVKLAGISGSLSMDNAKKTDDIDLFIISKAGSLWLTRFFVNLVLASAKIKRRRDSLDSTDKICPNMFISEDDLTIDDNLFSAHEIVQLKVLFDKEHTYEKFMFANVWVRKYMPNSFVLPSFAKYLSKKVKKNILLLSLDRLFFITQFLYMKKGLTTEKVSINLAKFHPQDKTKFTQLLYQQRYQFFMKSFGKNLNSQPQNEGFSRPRVTPGY